MAGLVPAIHVLGSRDGQNVELLILAGSDDVHGRMKI